MTTPLARHTTATLPPHARIQVNATKSGLAYAAAQNRFLQGLEFVKTMLVCDHYMAPLKCAPLLPACSELSAPCGPLTRPTPGPWARWLVHCKCVGSQRDGTAG